IERSAFEDMVRQYMAAHTALDWRWRDRAVEVLGPDAAVFSGSWTLTQTDTTGARTDDAGVITFVYERRSGEWEIVHAHESLSGTGGTESEGNEEPIARRSSMDATTMKDLARRWIRGIWDEQDVDLLNELTTPGYTYAISNDEPMEREAFVAFIQSVGTAFPDLRNTIEEQVVEGNLVITRGITVATHGGPLGELEATGRTVSVPFVMFTRFQDGKIASDWELYDAAGMMAQLAGENE
ncbi:MAG: ester cyclase, partial [Longimicrobiales bacterium]